MSERTEGEWYARNGCVLVGEYANEGEPDLIAEVVSENPQVDAYFIATAVNNHHPLLEALKDLTDCLGRRGGGVDAMQNIRKAYDKALDAITKAEEGSHE
jgi:hypothetical protein